MGMAGCCSRKPVNFSTQVQNAGKVAFRVSKTILSGRRVLVDEETFQKRYDICSSCEEYNKTKDQCNVCGCYIASGPVGIGKAKIASEFCPKFKWNHVEV